MDSLLNPFQISIRPFPEFMYLCCTIISSKGSLEYVIKNAGGIYKKHKINNDKTITVYWDAEDRNFVTILNKDFRVVHAGFCVSGYDDTQTIGSLVNLLKTYINDGESIHLTRE